jgi:uncharacterized iron-regulated membrane protein
MHRIVRQLHLLVALGAGAFLAVFGATGAIMAFEPELDRLLHPQRSYVDPEGASRAGSRPRSLDELGRLASAVIPGERVTGFRLSESAALTYQVQFRGKSVFIDQYTGKVLGVSAPGPDFLARVHQLHLRLLVQNRSDTGKTIMSWAGIAMLFLLLTGVYLWWPLKRITVHPRAGGRRFWFDLHNAMGILSFVFLFAVAVTGIVIGFDDHITPWFYRITRSAPRVMYAPPPKFQVTPSGSPIGPDRAIAIARSALPGAEPISINVPPPAGVYSIAARFPEDRTPGGRSRIFVDQYSGAVLLAEGSRTAPAGSRLITLNRAIHTGDVFGLPSKIVMSLASLVVLAQLVSGVAMWIKRQASR